MADVSAVLKVQGQLKKSVSDMTESERLTFRLSVDADSMGSEDAEGVSEDVAPHS